MPKMVAGKLRPLATATQVKTMIPKKPTKVPIRARSRANEAIFTEEAVAARNKRARTGNGRELPPEREV